MKEISFEAGGKERELIMVRVVDSVIRCARNRNR